MEPIEPLEPTPEEAETVGRQQIDAAVSVARRIGDNIQRAVKVRDDILETVIVSLLAEGHVLVEDYPGVGKTALARALSRSIDCQFARVQCTADLLPADIVGTNVYNQREGRFEFRPGPIFANVVIVDEINRASPKTQSGLLECMQERQVTVDATSHELARAVPRVRDPEPGRVRGHVPAARGAGRPLHDPRVARLPERRGRGRDARRPRGARPRARPRGGRRPGRGGRSRRRRPSRARVARAARLHRRPDAPHARRRAGGARRARRAPA